VILGVKKRKRGRDTRPLLFMSEKFGGVHEDLHEYFYHKNRNL
jgi:hypothetical protein